MPCLFDQLDVVSAVVGELVLVQVVLHRLLKGVRSLLSLLQLVEVFEHIVEGSVVTDDEAALDYGWFVFGVELLQAESCVNMLARIIQELLEYHGNILLLHLRECY